MKTAAIYVRVSTADQHVESQLYDLRELAVQRGYEVVGEYRDSGVSGKRARRPGLDALIADARRKKFSVVLVAAFDRVARSVKLDGVRIGRAPMNIDRAAIVRDRLSGISLTAVSKKWGVSRSLVCKLVNRSRGGDEGSVPSPTQVADLA